MILKRKVSESINGMEKKCAERLAQIEKGNYAQPLTDDGYQSILKYAVCFFKKGGMVRKSKEQEAYERKRINQKKEELHTGKTQKNLKNFAFSHPFWQKGWGFLIGKRVKSQPRICQARRGKTKELLRKEDLLNEIRFEYEMA